MTETSVEDLMITVIWLTIAGAEASSVCGMTIRVKMSQLGMPTDMAASRCPRGTPSIPARKVSAR